LVHKGVILDMDDYHTQKEWNTRAQLSEQAAEAPALEQVGGQERDPVEEIAMHGGALELLQHEMRAWPRSEREAFELYYVEGMEPEQIEMVTGYALNVIQESLTSVREKLNKLKVAV
jgi:DNA-directed RNA polymerase specialized sigma24 family protein